MANSPPRSDRTTRWGRWLATLGGRRGWSLPGAWTALVLACLSFLPSLIPRPAVFQGVLMGANAALGYGVGVLGAWCWRELAAREPRAATSRQWRGWAWGSFIALLSSLALGARWQRDSAQLVGVEPESPFAGLLILPVAAVLFAVLVGSARLSGAAVTVLAERLGRHLGPRPARLLGTGLVIALTLALGSGVLFEGLRELANATYALADGSVPDGTAAPDSPLRSGSPESLVEWEALGYQGRAFVARGPNAREIHAWSGAPARDPIRTYAGLDSAQELEGRAALAVDDLERAGGFRRQSLLIVTSTGTGWVEPTSVTAFEFLTGGDCATVSLQYSFLPSPLSFLADREKARDAGRALFDFVYERWSRLPANARPRLYVFGESLGSYGGEAAFSGEHDMANRLNGAVFTGPPSINPLYRSFVERRASGTREIEPVFRDGRTVRFTLDPRRPARPADAPWDGTRILYMQHPSDPITWWNPAVLLHRPDWLVEPRGDDVSSATRWVPLVTFWQLTADMPLGMLPGPGHGHNFAGEHVDAWAQVLRSPGWPAARFEALREAVRVRARGAFAPTE